MGGFAVALTHRDDRYAQLTKGITYDQRLKMKRESLSVEKDFFQSGISLHFRLFIVCYGCSIVLDLTASLEGRHVQGF